MKLRRFAKMVTFAGCLVASLPAAFAQNSILLLGDSSIEPTASTTTGTTPYVYQSTTQQLTCPNATISAVISSGQNGTQNLLVKDQILVSVTPAGGQSSFPSNVCPVTEAGFYPLVCFNPATTWGQQKGDYLTPFIGLDPDGVVPAGSPYTGQTYAQAFGVGPIQIGQMLFPGITQLLTVQLQNVFPPPGSNLGNTSLYLYTNCTSGGVTGPSTVVNGTPPAGGQQQTFTLNSPTNNSGGITFDYTYPPNAPVQGCTGQADCLTEHVTDNPINQATFVQNYTVGTSFSTASCYLHQGEVVNGNPACKMFQLLCSLGNNPAESGANCPASNDPAEEEIFGESFDPPNNFVLSNSLQDVQTTMGTYHLGVGLLMGPDYWGSVWGAANPWAASQPWLPGSAACEYTAGTPAAQANQMCPQNLLFNFSGPGSSNSQGKGENVNSTFITVYGVPMPLTTVAVTDQFGNSTPLQAGNWTNNASPYVQLSTTPPLGIAGTAAGMNTNFVAAPIQNVSYGVTGPGVTVPPPSNEQYGPISGDTTLSVPTGLYLQPYLPSPVAAPGCPTDGYAGTPAAEPVATAPQQLSLADGNGVPDGNYLLHYYAQDCAGTQELQFLENAVVDNMPSWTTNFYTYPINLDTTAPTISLSLSPAGGSYTVGQAGVTANFSCTDPSAGTLSTYSGLSSCGPTPGATTFSIGNNGSGPQNSPGLSSPISTATAGLYTFTVNATDFAGNTASQSVNYSVLSTQTINFTAPTSPVTYGVMPITLVATGGGSGKPVTFSVTGPCSVMGSTLTITGAGNCQVTANQAAGGLYAAAQPVQQNVMVNQATLVATANNLSMTTGSAVPTLTYGVTGYVNGDTAAVLSGAPILSTTAKSTSSAGNYPITITQGTLAAANYTFSFVNGTMSVVSPPIPILTSTSTVTGTAAGGYTLTINITNSGTGPANNVTLTAATLGTTSATGLPVNIGTVASGGGTGKFIVSVPGSAGANGAGVAEKYSGTYTGGSFSTSLRSVTLP